MENNELQAKLLRLEQERDELKQLNNQLLDDLYFEREQSKDFEIHFTRVDLENETLKSALEEIREIIIFVSKLRI